MATLDHLGMGYGRKYFKNIFTQEDETTKILLPDGTFAIIDTNQLKFVKDYNWYYYQSKHHDVGVIAIKGRQHIRLHNLIAPFPKVKHLNGDKRDCRKINLKKWDYPQLKKNHRKDHPGKSRFLSIISKPNRFTIRRRFLDKDGIKKQIGWNFFFQGRGCKYNNREEAYEAAKQVFDIVSKWDRYDIEREYDKRRESRGKIVDALLGWSAWENGAMAMENFYDLSCHEKNKLPSFRIS